MNIIDKTCLIADASETLGKNVGLFLAKQGAKIVLCFDCKEKIDNSYLKQLDEIGCTYKTVVCDFLSFEVGLKLVEDIKQDSNFNRLDSMFYNVTPEVVRQSVSEMPREILEKLIDHYVIKLYCATKVIGDFIGENGGTIIYRGSVNDDKPTGIAGFNSMYYAVVKNINREAALYYGYHNVGTACLEFGAIDKEDEQYHNEISTFYDGYDMKIPSGHIGNTEDFGSLISLLVSNECKVINGAEIRVDGGLLFQYIEPVMNIAIHRKLQREGKE